MAIYSFKIKKDKFVLELTTSDKELLSEQFELWIKSATEYNRKKKSKECKELVNNQIKAEEEITQKNIEVHIAKYKEAELPSLENINEKKEASEQEVSTEKDLDIFYTPAKEVVADFPEKKVSKGGFFDDILENSMKKPKTELTFKSSPTIQKDNAFVNYMGSRKIERKIDYLLLTAYYFMQYEQRPRFTLKQLNAKLMQNLALIIDHAVLQEAINRDYIECLPDLTGLVGASEYRLTSYGEKVLLDE